MRRKWIFVAAPVALAVFVFIGGLAVMVLWNWLLPALFTWPRITFWQALGLLALCRILFGGFGMRGGGMHRSHFRRRMAERWDRMTPEEREKFCQGLHGRWGREIPSDSKASV
jgi:hypothetical protein